MNLTPRLRRTSWITAAAAAAALVAAAPAMAQFKDAKDAIEYRQGAMKVMGHHFGHIGAMVHDKLPFDAQAARDDAAVVSMLVHLPWPGFVAGSDHGDTDAKPVVWSEPEKFKEAARKAEEAAARLDAAAKTGDKAQIKVAFGEMGQTCKSCHDHFKKD